MNSVFLLTFPPVLSAVLAIVITFWLSRIFRPKATNLELHKLYKAKQPTSTIKKIKYETLTKQYLAREVRNSTKAPSGIKLLLKEKRSG